MVGVSAVGQKSVGQSTVGEKTTIEGGEKIGLLTRGDKIYLKKAYNLREARDKIRRH